MFKTLFSLMLLLVVSGAFGQKPLNEKQIERRNYQEVVNDYFVPKDTLQPDRYPMYPDGMKGVMKDIQRNLRYPMGGARTGLSGKVVLSYVIDTLGGVTDIEVMKSHSALLDKAAIRAVQNGMRRWVPAMKDAKPVRCRYGLPVNFEIEKPRYFDNGEDSWE